MTILRKPPPRFPAGSYIAFDVRFCRWPGDQRMHIMAEKLDVTDEGICGAGIIAYGRSDPFDQFSELID